MLRESGGTVFVGGMAIGGAPQPPPVAEKRGRGKGRGERAPPHCKACIFEEAAEQRQLDCPGAKPRPPKGAFFVCSAETRELLRQRRALGRAPGLT